MTIIPVDNPLADPFDAELIGYHAQQKVEITLKCTEKTDPEEKVGVVVRQEGRCAVVEYSEMSGQEKNARRKDGRLKHCCANLSLFCLSLGFIQRIVNEGLSIPLHKAWKAAQFVDEHSNTYSSSQPAAWKFETFIFDWLFHSKKVAALICPREECFAPLKNLKGPDSPETVRLPSSKEIAPSFRRQRDTRRRKDLLSSLLNFIIQKIRQGRAVPLKLKSIQDSRSR